ncbi:hypothetical protein O0L34_g9586 [Tuta absoluta]|nr:hypothetical protein O0L34_g9586 [Tuta absoluta]
MILYLSSFLVYLTGTVAAYEADNTNRVHLIPQENYSVSLNEYRDSVRHKLRTNDYVNRSSRVSRQLPPLPKQIHVPSRDPKNTPLRVHQPKEDPRTFYQSDVYLKEIDGQNINKEVTFVYPGKEVNRASETYRNPMSLRAHDRQHNIIGNGVNICVRCPHDRTLVARPGTDKVFFQFAEPRLVLCSGKRAPKSVRFVPVYGPKYGSLIEQGTHLIVGRIMFKNDSIQWCKMHVHVITQGCATPNNLISHCIGQNCTFTCRNPHMELQGQSTLQCGNDMKWIGKLPYCRARTGCVALTQLEHVRKISCHTPNKHSAENSVPSYVEGTKCRLRCKKGWRWNPRAVSICRQGEWTVSLNCHRTAKRKNMKFSKP